MSAEATQDLIRYGRAMAALNGHLVCAGIERKYGLFGYPPEIVSVGLRAAAAGHDASQAVDEYLERA